mgnify:CR=1 FL=1
MAQIRLSLHVPIRRTHEMLSESKGKVLFIASVYNHLAAFHKPFMRLLQDKGYEVHSAASSSSGRMNEIDDLGVKCWDIPFCRSPYNPQNLEAYRKLKMLLSDSSFDLIHVHTPTAAFMTRWIARKLRSNPVLYTAHGFHFYDGAPLKNWVVYYTAERIVARWTNGLIVMNEEDHKTACRMGFTPNENLFHVHGVGVSLEDYSPVPTETPVRTELGIGKSDVVITCVAELSKRKNQAFLLDAWEKLSLQNPQIHLLLIGKGNQEENLKQRVSRRNLERVYFLGYCKDVPRILRGSDIVTLVSKHEGLPRCVMEAMAIGRPVVGTDIRGIRDLVSNGQTGTLVKLGDVDGLCAALEELIHDKQKRISMGQAARQKIEAYSLEQVLEEMSLVYARYLDID